MEIYSCGERVAVEALMFRLFLPLIIPLQLLVAFHVKLWFKKISEHLVILRSHSLNILFCYNFFSIQRIASLFLLWAHTGFDCEVCLNLSTLLITLFLFGAVAFWLGYLYHKQFYCQHLLQKHWFCLVLVIIITFLKNQQSKKTAYRPLPAEDTPKEVPDFFSVGTPR